MATGTSRILKIVNQRKVYIEGCGSRFLQNSSLHDGHGNLHSTDYINNSLGNKHFIVKSVYNSRGNIIKIDMHVTLERGVGRIQRDI